MKKVITNFREESYGLFLDLEDKPAAVAVDPQNGLLQLNEGDSPDRFHRPFFYPDDIQEIVLEEEGDLVNVYLLFCADKSHLLGSTSNKQLAETWGLQVNSLIDQFRSKPIPVSSQKTTSAG